MALNHKIGREVGAEVFIKNYDKYRRYSVIPFAVLGLWFLFTDYLVLAFISFGIMHLQVLFNQLWWKLVNIEYHYIKARKDGKL